jgi:hypothetical protein
VSWGRQAELGLCPAGFGNRIDAANHDPAGIGAA